MRLLENPEKGVYSYPGCAQTLNLCPIELISNTKSWVKRILAISQFQPKYGHKLENGILRESLQTEQFDIFK